MHLLVVLWISLFCVEALIYISYYLYMKNVVRRQPLMDKNERDLATTVPTVALCIPTHNEQENIIAKLENTTSLDYPKDRIKVVVIDDCSSDSTEELVRHFMEENPDYDIQLISKRERKGKLDSVNSFLSKSHKTDIVGVSDADAFVEEKALRSATYFFQDPTVGVVCAGQMVESTQGRPLASELESVYRKMYIVCRSGESIVHSTPILQAGLWLLRNGLVSQIRTRSGADDTPLAFETIRKGYRALYLEGATFCERNAEKPSIYRMTRSKARRGKHIAIVFLENMGMLLNPTFGKFGTVIFPVEFYMYVISPVVVTLLLVTFPFLIMEWAVFLGLLLGFSSLMLKREARTVCLSFIATQLAAMLGIISLIFGQKDILY